MPTLEDFLSHPIENLERALHIRKQIAALEDGLKGLFGPTPVSLAGMQTEQPRRRGRPKGKTMPAAARAKIANAQRLRWAKSKGLESATQAGPVEPSPVSKTRKKRTMSAAGRARVAAAQRARWAKVKGMNPSPGIVWIAGPDQLPAGLSAEERAKIIAAQKNRWTKAKSEKPTPAPVKSASKKKRHLSPEVRARIVAAVKTRWAREKGRS